MLHSVGRSLDLECETALDLTPILPAASLLRRLTYLAFTRCPLEKGIPTAVPQLVGLKHLAFTTRGLNVLPPLSLLTRLTSLELLYEDVSPKEIQQGLCKHTSLVRLALTSTEALSPEIVGLMQGLTHLNELRVRTPELPQLLTIMEGRGGILMLRCDGYNEADVSCP